MLTDEPQVPRLRARRPRGIGERIVEVEGLRLLALLPGVEGAKDARDLVLAEAREGHIDGGVRLQIAEEPGEQLVVPITGDTVEGQTQQSRLLDADVHPDDRHRGHPESASSDQALVTADDRGVLPPDEDRLDESELAQAAGQRV